MSPTGRPNDGRRPASMGSTVLPLVTAVCTLVLVRLGLEKFVPGLNAWVVFALSLLIGWLVYTGVERLQNRRRPAPRTPPRS